MKPSIELIRLVSVILITLTHTRNELQEGSVKYTIVEILPTYGTAILSIISGYLYINYSSKRKNIWVKKIKSLAIPYLIANISILVLVLIANYIFDYNALNRLTYDYTLISEGILSLNSPPINPPTYYVRDIFIIYSVIALVTKKEYKTLFILVPILIFGILILRYDIVILFLVGCIYAKYEYKVIKPLAISLICLSVIISGAFFFEYLKYPVATLIFISVIDLKINMFNTGRYSYLLHLYHTPIIVVSYPILNLYIDDDFIKVISQVVLSILGVYFLFLASKKIPVLKVLSGGR